MDTFGLVWWSFKGTDYDSLKGFYPSAYFFNLLRSLANVDTLVAEKKSTILNVL